MHHNVCTCWAGPRPVAAESPCPWLIAETFNVLLAQVADVVAGDPVAKAIKPLTAVDRRDANADCGSVRALARQLQSAVSEASRSGGPTVSGAVPWQGSRFGDL